MSDSASIVQQPRKIDGVDAPSRRHCNVPFFSGAKAFRRSWPQLQQRLSEIIDTGKYTNGPVVAELEEYIKAYTQTRYAVAVDSGTSALIILLRAAGVGPGDEVIVPCFTFFASASSIVHVGARPVFVDIDPVSYALDPAATEAAISDKSKAIMPVHLFCQMADMESLQDISHRTGVPILEDSAEAMGMWFDGQHAGNLGQGGVLSFFPTKTLGALGDGGMILTNNAEVAELAQLMRDHGRRPGGSRLAEVAGYNGKMDEIQAAVLLARLEHLDDDIQRRAVLADRYNRRLSSSSPAIKTPHILRQCADTSEVFYSYVIEAENKEELVQYLANEGIETEQYYPLPLHLQPCFHDLGYRRGDFPTAERASLRTIALPLYPDLTDLQVDAVCQVIENFVVEHRGASN